MTEASLYAAIDLGSNSFHMLVARREHGELRVIDRIKDMVRLAGGIDENGLLDPAARSRALDCLARFGQRIAAIPGNQVRAVGTQAFRQLDNPAAFLVVAETALGCAIDIVSGREEARLVYLGVSQATAYSDRRLVIDVGGGSTELVIGESLDPLLTESIPVGCVSMTRRAFAEGRLDRERWQLAVQSVQGELLDMETDIRRTGWQQVVGSSGTIRALEAMATRLRDEETGRISLVEVERLREMILAAGHVDRIELPGLSERRRPVIAGGTVILEAVMKQLGLESMAVSPHALREGVLHDLLGRLSHKDPRARTVTAMANRYQCDPDQASRVRDWAMQAVDQATGPWQLTSIHVELLGWACQLHELGLAIAHDQHPQHGAYLIEHADMPGFSRQEQQFMATLVATQRYRLDRGVIERQASRLHNPLRRLIAIMRLAVTMCRARIDSDIPEFSMDVEADRISLRLPDGWLESHPLSARGLAYQNRQLEKIGLALKIEVLSCKESPT